MKLFPADSPVSENRMNLLQNPGNFRFGCGIKTQVRLYGGQKVFVGIQKPCGEPSGRGKGGRLTPVCGVQPFYTGNEVGEGFFHIFRIDNKRKALFGRCCGNRFSVGSDRREKHGFQGPQQFIHPLPASCCSSCYRYMQTG